MPWVSYGQKGEGTKTSGSWQPYGTKKKQDKKKAVIEESLKQAEKYFIKAEKMFLNRNDTNVVWYEKIHSETEYIQHLHNYNSLLF